MKFRLKVCGRDLVLKSHMYSREEIKEMVKSRIILKIKSKDGEGIAFCINKRYRISNNLKLYPVLRNLFNDGNLKTSINEDSFIVDKEMI